MRPVRLLLAVPLAAVVVAGSVAPCAPADPAPGPRTWRVGPERALTTPSAAAAVARDGDTVLIDAGAYPGDVATWTQDDVTLRAVGGRVRLTADGRSAQGKAIWVVAGDRTRVEAIEFSGAAVPDRNGAGIRQEGTGLTVVRSVFHHNENGILAGADAASDIRIHRSRFHANGAGDGYSHNVYVGEVRSLTVTGSVLGGASVGHELKSRALRTTVTGNRIVDGAGTASYSIDVPNGGETLIAGNVVEQGASSQNPVLVAYGAEGLTHPGSRLWVVNNTLVNRGASATHVALFGTGAETHLWNNLLVGPGDLTDGAAERRGNRRAGARGFVDAAAHDFRLLARSPARDRGVRPPRRWRARWIYVAPLRLAPRPRAGRLDVGAYEFVPRRRRQRAAGDGPGTPARRAVPRA
ncbi:right-handed parallel beta-helix repeat-containing protein [Nocardioides sp. 1609]|uniref:right-handed parallel beta-helix repeat-containing protein n=1 Tax=Nocardioides sp. 1609 TaxID=2508327 RepID=UPI0014301404|nr:right-handed parallel beta-helix repeat-containing protein [Nocardioides sp. 1609]